MPRPHLTQVQVDDFRSEVISEALDMIAEHGVAGLTLRALAKRLGCSYAKPYRYFKDKDELLDAVRGHGFELLARFMDGEGPAAALAPRERYLRFAFDHPEAFRVMFELRQDFTSQETRAAEARAWKVCAQPFHDAVDSGRLEGNPEQIAHVAWAAHHGLASLALANKLHHGMAVDEIAAGLEAVVAGFESPEQRVNSQDPVNAKPYERNGRNRSSGGR
jgi:AcrR family transcriptional regulator